MLKHFISNQELILQPPSVQKQSGGIDCGLFTLAFATALCHNNDPAKMSFYQKSMRTHFNTCNHEELIRNFPHHLKKTASRNSIIKSINLTFE